MPPIGRTVPSSASSPVAAIRQPCVTLRPSWRAISSANGRPAEGPPTSPRSMSTSNGSSIFASWSTRIPMMARDGSCGLGDRTNGDVDRLAAAPNREADVVAGLAPSDLAAELGRRSHGHAVDGDDHVARLEHLRRRDVGRDAGDEHAARRRDDVVAERAQRDDRRDLLGALHVRGVLAVALLRRSSRRARSPAPGRASTPSGRVNGRSCSRRRIRRTKRST